MSLRSKIIAVLLAAFAVCGFAASASAASSPAKLGLSSNGVAGASATAPTKYVFTASSGRTYRSVTFRVKPSWKGGVTKSWKVKNFQRGRTIRRTVSLQVPSSSRGYQRVRLSASRLGRVLAAKIVKVKARKLPVVTGFTGQINRISGPLEGLVPGVPYTYKFAVQGSWTGPKSLKCGFAFRGVHAPLTLVKGVEQTVIRRTTFNELEVVPGPLGASVTCQTASPPGQVYFQQYWQITGSPPVGGGNTTGITRGDLTATVAAGAFSGVPLGTPVTPPIIQVVSTKSGVLNATLTLGGVTRTESITFQPGEPWLGWIDDGNGRWTYSSLEEVCKGLLVTFTNSAGVVVFRVSVHNNPAVGSCATPGQEYGTEL